MSKLIGIDIRSKCLRVAVLSTRYRRVAVDALMEVDIDEETLGRYLYTSGQPDPDLLIRTSGELRVSNFLLWQIAYTELWVTRTLWPDFRRRDLFEAVLEYQQRDRRYGGVKQPEEEDLFASGSGTSSLGAESSAPYPDKPRSAVRPTKSGTGS